MLVPTIISGLLMGFIFSLISLGLAIIFGVMDIVNFAHGEFLMVGMYLTFISAVGLSIDPLLVLPIAGAGGFILGVLTYYSLINKLLRGPMLAQLLGTFALMLFLRYMAMLIFGTGYRKLHAGIIIGKSVEIDSIILPYEKLAAAILSFVLFGAAYLLVYHTRFGRALRATSLNVEAAKFMGINTEGMRAMAWGLGGLTVAVAGSLLANYFYIFPTVGLIFTMIAFTTVALGGFGSIRGAFVAGLIVGLIYEIGGFYVGNQWKLALIYLIYVAVVILRPQGLFGWER